MSQPWHDEDPTTPLPVARMPIAQPPSRRRWWFIALTAGAVALAALVGTALALLGGSTPSAAPAAPAALASPSEAGGQLKAAGRTLRGTIVIEAGSTWTVRTRAGRTVTVLITGQTRFGTDKAPKTATDFPVGTAVAVTGTVDKTTLTALRITVPAAPSPSPTRA